MPKNYGVLHHRNLLPSSAWHFNTEIHQLYTSGLILVQGANSQMSREQGGIKMDLGSTETYFGEHQEKYSRSWEKRVKIQREPGAGDPPPLTGSHQC